MKWLEIIELRSASSNRELLVSILQKLIDEVDTDRRKQSIMAYSRVFIDPDFRIHLLHDSKNVENN